MATYFTDDFADFSTDWTDRWEVGEVTVTSGNLVVRAAGASDLKGCSWDDIDGDADRDDVEVLTKCYFSAGATAALNGPFVRGSGAEDSQTCYMVRIRTSEVRVYKFVGNTTFTEVCSFTQTFTNLTDAKWVRLRVNGTNQYLKVWEGAIGDEPGGTTGFASGYTAIGNDTSITAAGWVGGNHWTNATTAYITFDLFGVGTNGDTAPSAAGSTAVSFAGTVPTINGTRKTAFAAQSPTIASYFSGTETPFSYAVQSGTLPAGLSINSSTGVISGTPTVTGTATGIVIRATDATPDTADTNSFSIAIAAAAVPDLSDVAMTSVTGTTAVVNVDVYF